MSERTDAKHPGKREDEPVVAPKTKPASEAPPVSGPNAPASGNDDGADKTDSNRKGGYGTS